MANSGKFYPFDRYVNDIALIMDGTHRIIPSKYILLKELKNKSPNQGELPDPVVGPGQSHNATILAAPGTGDVSDQFDQELAQWNWPDDVVDFVNSMAQTGISSLDDINYKDFRKKSLNFLLGGDASSPNDIKDGYKYYIGGDITFLSHDVYDGMIYSEIYVHVPNDAGRYRVRVNNTNQDQELKVLTELEPFNGEDPSFEFQAVLLFYNIYKAGSDTPYAVDIPLGIFVLFDVNRQITSQELLIQDPHLMGNGTAWSTRICSRFISSASINKDVNITTSPSDYNTMTRILAEMGSLLNTMERNISSREEDMLTIKSYLDNFKHSQTVNVPYVLGDWWYVNGRPIRPVDELELVLSQGNQYSWTSTEDLTWPYGVDEDSRIADYLNGVSGVRSFLTQCVYAKNGSVSGRFEGLSGTISLDAVDKTIAIECLDADHNNKVFKIFNYDNNPNSTETTYDAETNKVII